MYVITGRDKGNPPFCVQSQSDDLDTARRICRTLVGLPNTEFIGLYSMDAIGALSLVESWMHDSTPAQMPVAPAVRSAKPPNGARAGKGTPETVQDDSDRFEGYCVKCKAKREFAGRVELTSNGRRMAKGECPVCSTKMNRILPNA